MKTSHLLRVACLLAPLWPLADLTASYVSLTNEAGRVIEAKLLSLQDGRVQLEPRGDYRSYDYPLADLDAASRQRVQAHFESAREKLARTNAVTNDEAGPEAESEARPERRRYKIDLEATFKDLDLEPRNQGPRGTCSVFAVTHLLDYTLARAGVEAEISPEFLNWSADQADGHTFDGAFFHHLLEGLASYGFVMEKDLRYRKKYRPRWQPDETLLAKAAQNRMLLSDRLNYKVHWIREPGVERGMSETHLDQIIQALELGYPVAIGGTHSICLLGYEGRGGADKRGVFRAVDSAPGYFRDVSYDYMLSEAIEAFYIETTSKPSGEMMP